MSSLLEKLTHGLSRHTDCLPGTYALKLQSPKKRILSLEQCALALMGCCNSPSFHFPKDPNGKAPSGRQPLLKFCLAGQCNPGLGNFRLGYLQRPECQNLNQIKLQPYQE
ncbi:hypothetical protein TNCV_1945001 [Trichonephila clavipes]|nr:hypothetical protein TNCV_1945001 [Trichonephila clavipes]